MYGYESSDVEHACVTDPEQLKDALLLTRVQVPMSAELGTGQSDTGFGETRYAAKTAAPTIIPILAQAFIVRAIYLSRKDIQVIKVSQVRNCKDVVG
jgi:hypothetical protein